MDRDRFRQLLEELHRELSTAEALDPEARRALDEVVQDLRRLETGAAPGSHVSAAQRLRQVILDFESAHPRLALAAGQVADALGKLGI